MEAAEPIEHEGVKPQRMIVEIGPGERDRALINRLFSDQGTLKYFGGDNKEALFELQSGDMFVEVDLLPSQSVDVFRHGDHKAMDYSHLPYLKKSFEARLPDGVQGELVHADGTHLPFDREAVDIIFIANVLSGHIKDDTQTLEDGVIGFTASEKEVQVEKQRLIAEIKRVLRPGGMFIVEEEFPPYRSGRAALNRALEELQIDQDFEVETTDDGYRLILKLTKRNESSLSN
ncbi:MAG: hypothetical protein UZ21_OP11001000426 [Microgenomates bacterium OLB22]|nr:MAG: hypothetical protein UZ21_OP11001000426 [Microgenomates bacterium OLB22]